MSDQSNSSPDTSAEPSAVETLQYNPFEGLEPGDTSSDSPPPDPAAGDQVPQGQEPPAPPPQVPPQAQPTGPDPATQARMDALERIIGHRLQTQEQPAQPAAPAAPELPPYTFTIPPQLAQMFEAEDPATRVQAVAIAMTATAKAVHANLMQEFGQKLQQLSESLPDMMSDRMGDFARRQSIFNDFYGTYPQLSHPGLRPLVREVTARVYQARGGQENWNPQLRDAIAREVAVTLQSTGLQFAQPAAPPQPQRPNGRAQPPDLSGVRGPPATPQDRLTAEIMDLMKF